ncbi:MAG: CHAT domain-containing protein [Leptolyngbyaceae cyanobacterium SU_3_3]|nr:CHAT domain-containing protein [Leptolyngbyaceae cyanobacterium SU_3_3]
MANSALEPDFKRANIQTLLYAPDGQLRYIPLAALHDGDQWLVQKYRINNITASSIDKFTSQPQPQLKILAGAFANASIQYTIPIGTDRLLFNGLPGAGKEVETLATIPGTVKYRDRAFSLQAVKPRMNGFSVVHLATHASFVPGQPESSFILFGDGTIANLKDIEKWDLENVDLVVLSDLRKPESAFKHWAKKSAGRVALKFWD